MTAYINEVKESIMIYDNVLNTNNEVLNTILSEKNLYCQKYGISLSCIVDGEKLDFMNIHDIYALLGNALNNAIECVMNNKDKEKRVISLSITEQKRFLSIQTTNYLEKNVIIKDGLPVSKKKDKVNHGFGIKSMNHITEKYGGTLQVMVEDDMFILQIVIPIP